MFRRLAIILVFVLVAFGSLKAQVWKKTPIEAFAGLSGLHYFGDIGGSPDASNMGGLKDINFSKIRPGIYFGARYRISKPFQIKAYFASGFLAQSDYGSRNEARNFAFSTFTNELSVLAEFYIIPESDDNYFYSIMQIRGGLRHFRQPWALYVFGGAGALQFLVSPRESLVGSSRFIDDKSFSFVIPVGLGAKYAVMPRISLGMEFGVKYAFTDFLDGFTSPSSQHNDIFYSFVLKLNYKLNVQVKQHLGVPKKRRRFSF
jgi:hypothetical protein